MCCLACEYHSVLVFQEPDILLKGCWRQNLSYVKIEYWTSFVFVSCRNKTAELVFFFTKKVF